MGRMRSAMDILNRIEQQREAHSLRTLLAKSSGRVDTGAAPFSVLRRSQVSRLADLERRLAEEDVG